MALAAGSVCAFATESVAHADPIAVVAPPEHPPALDAGPEIPLGEKRKPQDYDGRPPHTSVGEDLLWVPRVLLFPLYFTTDYLVRRPLGAIDTAIEKNDVIPRAIDLFTFGPNHNAGIVPTAFIDFGFQPSFGLFLFYNDFLAPFNDMRLAFSTGGDRWLSATAIDRIPLALALDADQIPVASSYLQLEIDALGRPDLLFFGEGWSTRYRDRGKYEMRTEGGSARLHAGFGKGNFFESWLTLRRYEFTNGDCDVIAVGPPRAIEDRTVNCTVGTIVGEANTGHYLLPAGFEGYAVTKAGGRLVLDSRNPRPYAGSGVALDVRTDVATAFAGHRGSWVSYGASLAGFLDLTGTRRVLSLTLDTRFADELKHDFAIPFTELVGAERSDHVYEIDMMEGFVPNRLLGLSSLSATLNYEWPVWTFADGTIQLAAGNSFGHHLEDFRIDRERLSFATGITSPNHRDHSFNLLVGFGTRPFREGATPESVRFLLGGTTGF